MGYKVRSLHKELLGCSVFGVAWDLAKPNIRVDLQE
jgi:hypothetical protein